MNGRAARDRAANAADVVRRLARRVSFAVRVDPVLLRRARMELVPDAGPEAEADVWFLPEVEATTPSGLVFAAGEAETLRRELAEEGPEAYEAAWEVTRACHAGLTPALSLEEEVNYLVGSDRPAAQERIRALIRSAVAALVSGDRKGLARWAARALPSFPDEVRRLEEARMLGAATEVRLSGHLGGAGARAREKTPEWLPWVAPVARVEVGVRLRPGILEVRPVAAGGPPTPGTHLLSLPETEPLVLDIEAPEEDPGEGEPALLYPASRFRLGDWEVWPEAGLLAGESEQVRLKPRVMAVLLHLVERAGETVSREEIASAGWGDDRVEGEELPRAIHLIRQALGDNARSPSYIETIPKVGYRLIAEVSGRELGPKRASRRSVRFREGEIRRVRVPGGALRLRSVLGEEYLLEPHGAGREIVDFGEELEAHVPVVLREEELARIDDAMANAEAGWIVVVGERGAGKTALLAEVVRTREPRPPHHFFRADLPAWGDGGRALRSLAAQLEGLLPQSSSPVGGPGAPDLRSLWHRLLELETEGPLPVVRPEPALVVDDPDQAHPGPGAPVDALLPRTLPSGMFGLVSFEPGSPKLEWLAAGGQVIATIELREPRSVGDLFWAIVDEADLEADERLRSNLPTIERVLKRLESSPDANASLGAPETARLLGELARAVDLPTEPSNDGLTGWLLELERRPTGGSEKSAIRGGDTPARRAVGALAAAREAIPSVLTSELLSGSSKTRVEVEPPLGLLVRDYERGGRDGGPVSTLRSRGVRQELVNALGEGIRREHQILLGSLAAWPVNEPTPSSGRREFALRHALYHARRAHNLEQAERLATDPAYLAARAEIDASGLLADVEDLRVDVEEGLAVEGHENPRSSNE